MSSAKSTTWKMDEEEEDGKTAACARIPPSAVPLVTSTFTIHHLFTLGRDYHTKKRAKTNLNPFTPCKYTNNHCPYPLTATLALFFFTLLFYFSSSFISTELVLACCSKRLGSLSDSLPVSQFIS